MSQQAQNIIETIRPILIKYGIRKADLFGSVARGEMRPDSDIDILVQFPHESGFRILGGVYRELTETLNKKIDLVEYEYVNKYIKDSVFSSTAKII